MISSSCTFLQLRFLKASITCTCTVLRVYPKFVRVSLLSFFEEAMSKRRTGEIRHFAHSLPEYIMWFPLSQSTLGLHVFFWAITVLDLSVALFLRLCRSLAPVQRGLIEEQTSGDRYRPRGHEWAMPAETLHECMPCGCSAIKIALLPRSWHLLRLWQSWRKLRIIDF